ncbi:MAG: glycosyltransferase family 9 protein [Pseudorhodoplanes sp.]|nr:glycosyltransferase family 9 protein [Pseudorhodoplanes sp.]
MIEQIDLPAHPRILVVALRRLGDVLLTTPLIRSLRRTWPLAKIDILVFSDTAAILEGNPDIDDVLSAPSRRNALRSVTLAARLWRKYDLAVTTQAGDRPTFLAAIAGRKRVGPVENRLIGRIKQLLLDRHIPMGEGVHRVDDVLSLARVLGVPPVAEVICPRPAPRPDLMPSKPYAVIHAAPMFRYKQWHANGWRAVASHLAAQGLAVVVTGGPGEAERHYLDEVWRDTDVLRLDGKVTWPELTAVLAGARVFLGPDTSVTHLAAAAGAPTVALYGPTDPRLWGPWPASGLDAPWDAAAASQQRGNVWLVQNPLPCQPCQHEGCLRNLQSFSRCLDELGPEAVIAALNMALTSGQRRQI